MNEFNFNSRETYLAFRTAWKKEYKELTLEIRKLKSTWVEEIKSGRGGSTIYAIIRKRKEATNMMQLLADAKLESARQWTAARQGEAA